MILSRDSLRAHARQSVEALNERGVPPVNPCPPGTDAAKQWALDFYQAALELEMSEQ